MCLAPWSELGTTENEGEGIFPFHEWITDNGGRY